MRGEFYQDKVFLPPAAEPQSRSARVYTVFATEMPGAPTITHTVSEMVNHAKRRHEKVSNYNRDELTARKIGESDEDITVVVIEP